MHPRELRFQERLHLDIAAVASDLDQVVLERQTDRIHPAIQQEGRSLDLVLAHGEVEGRAVCVLAAYERRVFLQKRLDRLDVAIDRGAEHPPDVGAGAG